MSAPTDDAPKLAGVSAISLASDESKVAFIRMALEDRNYRSPEHHVMQIGFSIALSVLLIGMAALLVLNTAGVLPG